MKSSRSKAFRALPESERAKRVVDEAVADVLKTLVRLAPSPAVGAEARRRLVKMGRLPRPSADLPGQIFIPGAEVSA